MLPTRIICLSDNMAPSGSGYWAEHGLSFYIESGDTRVLFDTGQSGDVLLHNARLAGVSLSGLDYIVLSHGHYDHTGGLLKVLELNEGATLVMHPAAFQKKFAKREGGLKDISLPFSVNELKEHCEVMIQPGPMGLGEGISTTGEIERVTPCEKPQPDLLLDEGSMPVADPMKDDQSITIGMGDELTLLCGCCHAGIINTLEHVKRKSGKYPAVIAGGLHMEKANDGLLSSTVEALRAAGVKKVVAGHCSGDEVLSRLSHAGIPAWRLTAGKRII